MGVLKSYFSGRPQKLVISGNSGPLPSGLPTYTDHEMKCVVAGVI